MSDLKVRAKSVETGELVYGWFCGCKSCSTKHEIYNTMYNLDNSREVGIINGDDFGGVLVYADTLEGYIGLKDVSGKEIHDGDMIVIDNTYPFFDEGKENYIGIVRWIFSSWQYVLKCVNSEKSGISNGINHTLNDYGYEDGSVTNYRIIGNIHNTEV